MRGHILGIQKVCDSSWFSSDSRVHTKRSLFSCGGLAQRARKRHCTEALKQVMMFDVL